jgi:hypothetical protein
MGSPRADALRLLVDALVAMVTGEAELAWELVLAEPAPAPVRA